MGALTIAAAAATPADEVRRVRGPRDPFAIDVRHHDDAALVAAIGRREQPALAEAYDRHSGPAFGLARRVLADRTLAEEVVQEVFLRLWNTPEKYDAERGTLRAYLLAQTHGRAVDLLRAETARRRRESKDAVRSPRVVESLDREILQLSQADAVRRALDSLHPNEREAIELAYFGGHTYREVAELLEQPEGTVKSRIRSGLGRLRTALAGLETAE